MRKGCLTVQGTYILLAALTLWPGVADAQHRGGRAGHHATAAAFDERMLATQVALDRAGFSPGEIDAQGGAKTRLALAAFQSSSSSPLHIPSEPLIDYTIKEHDVAGSRIDAVRRDLMDRAALPSCSDRPPL